MLVIDAHLDLSYNALNWNRDLRLSVAEIRRQEEGMTEKGRGTNTVAFPELRAGEVGVCLATVLARANPKGKSNIDHRTQEIAYAMAQGQLAYYKALRAQGVCSLVRDPAELSNVMEQWRAGSSAAPFGFILSMEGADPILSPGQLPEWWADGLRVVGLAHYGPSAYAHGTACSGGLTPKGRRPAARDGRSRNDSRPHPPGRRELLGSGEDLAGTAAGESQQLPGARPRRSPV